MKASEIISRLVSLVSEHGDLEVTTEDTEDYLGDGYEITRIVLSEDSEKGEVFFIQ